MKHGLERLSAGRFWVMPVGHETIKTKFFIGMNDRHATDRGLKTVVSWHVERAKTKRKQDKMDIFIEALKQHGLLTFGFEYNFPELTLR